MSICADYQELDGDVCISDDYSKPKLPKGALERISLADAGAHSEADEIVDTGEDGKVQKPKYKYMKFIPEAIKYSAIGHKFATTKPDKYTQIGREYNMCFKMLRSDSKLIKTVLSSYGYLQCSRRNNDVNLIWSNTHLSQSVLRTFLPWQRINHFPRSVGITKKDLLHQNLSLMCTKFPIGFDFFPKSYIFPDDKAILLAKVAGSTTMKPHISKPAASSRGRGISILNKPSELSAIICDERSKVLVSEYITNPLLVDRKKFDLRIYVAVMSFHPMIAYMFNDGLARFAVGEYTEEIGDWDDVSKHLTNYSLHKNNKDFIKNNDAADEDVGHKWTLSGLLRNLAASGHDTKLLMIRIEDIVVKTLLSIQSQVAAASRAAGLAPNSCFELFGFDILIDTDLKPWLLEVNLSPSLACDAPLDSVLKTKVICDTLNLAMVPLVYGKNSRNVSAGEEENINDDNDLASMVSASSGPTSRSTSPVSNASSAKKSRSFATTPFRRYTAGDVRPSGCVSSSTKIKTCASRMKCDRLRKGGFIRIFPRKNTYYMYKDIITETNVQNLDNLLYKEVNGVDPEVGDLADDMTFVHSELMSCDEYNSFDKLSPVTQQVLKEAYDEAEAYEAHKHLNGTKLYPRALPKLRPETRRRTLSCVATDEQRREQRITAFLAQKSVLAAVAKDPDYQFTQAAEIAQERKQNPYL
uniref:Tubulin--tyrosine ligase-like protein 5 n=1 Tax=Panagrellus redivivus TaxID=6233 RepID=A0A7E4VLN6_PANRE